MPPELIHTISVYERADGAVLDRIQDRAREDEVLLADRLAAARARRTVHADVGRTIQRTVAARAAAEPTVVRILFLDRWAERSARGAADQMAEAIKKARGE